MTEQTQQEAESQVIDLLHQTLDDGDYDRARDILAKLHPSEIADVLEGQPGKLREITWNLIEQELAGGSRQYPGCGSR